MNRETANNDTPANTNTNYGQRIDGHGYSVLLNASNKRTICIKQVGSYLNLVNVRMFKVEKRNSENFLLIIRAQVEVGSMLWSDRWNVYNQIGNGDGLHLEKVIHDENFVCPVRGIHTQNI